MLCMCGDHDGRNRGHVCQPVRRNSGRQLGLLWGGVAVLLVALSPWADRLAASLPTCPAKLLLGLPCLTCGTGRSAIELSKLDLAGALAVNPLATVVWILVVGGGLVAGLLASLGATIREPDWRLSRARRWLLIGLALTNWAYLVEAGS